MKVFRNNMLGLFVGLVGGILVGMIPKAYAGDDVFCARYAKDAVSQNKANIERGCGFRGPPWSSDYNAHFSWCMHGENARFAEREFNSREKLLSQCKRPWGTEAKPELGEAEVPEPVRGRRIKCERYAKDAVSQNKANIERGCGLRGPGWSSDYNAHFQWCMFGENVRYWEREFNVREKQLRQCPGKAAAPGPTEGPWVECDRYARSAVSQNKANLERGCGLRGPGWSSDYNAHFQWCMFGENVRYWEREFNAREKQLRQCPGKAAAPGPEEGPRMECDLYSKNAVLQNRLNIARGCGFKGPGWSSDYNAHFNWCLTGENVRYRERKFKAREEQLRQCQELAGREPERKRRPEEEFYEEYPSWNMPDLAVTRLKVKPERAQPGSQITLEAVIANLGTGDTEPTTVVFSVGDDEVVRAMVEGLTPTKRSTVQTQWVAKAPGRHVVRAELVFEEDAFDGDFSNNSETAVVRIGSDASPRPEIDFGGTDPAMVQIAAGKPTEFPIVVRNPGFVSLPDIPVELLVEGRVVSQGTIEGLASGAKGEIRLPWKDVKPGEHLVKLRTKLPTYPWYPDAALEGEVSWHVVVPPFPAKSFCKQGQKKDCWFSVGPRRLAHGATGRMDSIAFDEKNKIVYAGAAVSGSGGVWKSTDGGKSWATLTHHELPCLNVGTVAVDPEHPQIIYFTTGGWRRGGGCGLFKSIDGGATWYPFAEEWWAGGSEDLVIRYLKSGEVVLYAGTHNGVRRYRSKDPWAKKSYDKEWKTILEGRIGDMAVSPADNSLVYAFVFEKGLYRTSEGLILENPNITKWKQLTQGLPEMKTEYQLGQIDIWKANPMIMVASVSNPKGVNKSHTKEKLPHLGVYWSKNEGDSWTKQFYASYHQSLYNYFVRLSPINPSLVFYGGVKLFKKRLGSKDPSVKIEGIHDDMHGMAFDPWNPDYYYILGDGGIWRCRAASSSDCKHRNDGLRTLQIYDFDTSAKRADLVIAGTQDNGTVLWKGDSVWRQIRGGSLGADGYYSLIARDDDHVMYSQHQRLSSTERTDNGLDKKKVHWKAANKGLQKRYMGAGYITIHPNNKNYLVTAGDPVYFTTDGGKTWNKAGPKGSKHIGYGFKYSGKIYRLVIQPKTGTWIAGTTTGQLWYTSDKGKTWHFIWEHTERKTVKTMAIAPTNSHVVLVGFEGGEPRMRVARAVENPKATGKDRWQVFLIGRGFPANRNPKAIAGDGWDWRKVYVGTGRGVFRGVYTESPKYFGSPKQEPLMVKRHIWKWEPYNVGLPLADVRDLVVNPVSKQLLAATFGNGAWAVVTGP